MKHYDRRNFLKLSSACGLSLALGGCNEAMKTKTPAVPSYLRGYENTYALNPRQAAIEWFREAKFGLFIHYGLYSLLGRHEWVQLRETIHVAEYAKLKDRFTAENFDADFIT
ncbi:MAG: twin-arginine translocation signal domain-containing protein, partial [Planctomycetota bacterium]